VGKHNRPATREAMAALGRFRDHLSPGGLLLVDMPPMSFFEAPGGVRAWTAANRSSIESKLSRK